MMKPEGVGMELTRCTTKYKSQQKENCIFPRLAGLAGRERLAEDPEYPILVALETAGPDPP